ncbi:DNA repair protein rad2 [Ophidiomyces ophidiicola]|nr:DNA repair protein rad2 [Ophidiomyces ophidiicola]KAI1991466.1 DNA repair protein rad2 [Ophidiomyces ophidiicola]KAI1993724.1 DNA repair protein rad2 [Ophidiomyces ophidiicola]KAI2003349.1 DNA repair protein rad2 [Ophidiomyces ophidiicola]
MGVTGLWTVVKPCARPIKLETLNKKRLAVDASIWIYQFLKAVRDKEGNALRNAHIVGFFRRICKLLYFGIKPVFVFDGGAPVLKRQTIASRKKRREGRREDAARTAEKLLAVQLQKRADAEELKRKRLTSHEDEEAQEPLPENLVYAEEVFMTPKERGQNRQFRKKDAYHLPELDVSLQEMGAPNDPRIMSHEELEEYARQFHSGENINLYDFSNIDFDSPFFLSLPASDRYNILNAVRLRSRLRMGYSKDQLDTMFPDRMAFSKFQIERVTERNDLTQRLMHINGMNDDNPIYGSSSRISGDRNKEYVLVKDNGVEGGWALGVLGNREGEQKNKPIDVEEYSNQHLTQNFDESEDEDVEFEDVPIEGLNRLPKLPIFESGVFDESIRQNVLESAEKRQQLYNSRQEAAGYGKDMVKLIDDDELFIPESQTTSNIQKYDSLFKENDEENLRRAIQMSLEIPPDEGNDDDIMINESMEETSNIFNPRPEAPSSAARELLLDTDDDDMDLFAAITNSAPKKAAPKTQPNSSFDGLLPFKPFKITRICERPDHQTNMIDENAGGFEPIGNKASKEPPILPPWFSGSSQRKEFIEHETDDGYSGRDQYPQTTQASELVSLSGNPEIINLDDDVPLISSAIGADSNKSSVPSCPPHDIRSSCLGQAKIQQSSTAIIDSKRVANTNSPIGIQFASSKTNNTPAPQEKSLSPEFEDVGNRGLESNSYPVISFEPPGTALATNFEEEDDYSDPEDAELIHQLAAETEEHARFASTLNLKSQAENAVDYERELKQLRAQQKKDRRDADEVSQIMVTECQQLLQLFGLPYITAPMEAEAQCAELVSLGLVDGIVTDDSDIFLFGGTRVYKNMFNQAKFVECYLTSDLEKEYALDRKKLINFAHLLGSDYTEGIPGIGPVTALEILTEFSTLGQFTDWWSKVQMGVSIAEDVHSKFRKKFKKNATKLFLPPAFPDKRVETAYLEPEVDSDPSSFQWGVPDLEALRHFLMSTVGWSPERTDEVLVPVIRDVNRRELEGTQANITQFFDGPQGSGAFAPRRRAAGPTRMEKAFSRLRQEAEIRRSNALGDGPATPIDTDTGEAETEPATKSAKKRQKTNQSLADGDVYSSQTAANNKKTKRRKVS